MLNEIDELLTSEVEHTATVFLNSTSIICRKGTIISADESGIVIKSEMGQVSCIPWRSVLLVDVVEHNGD